MSHDKLIFRLGMPAVLCTWAIETGMNAIFGWRLTGGSPGYALMFVAFAVFGALLGVLFQLVRGNDPMAWVWRTLLAIPFAACFAASQVAGWSVASTSLADGNVQRQVKAVTGATARERLEQLREMQKKVGVAVSPGQIEAQIRTELARWVKGAGKTVGEASKDCAEPSWAPTICRKVAELKTELARARTAAELPEQIAAAAREMATAPQIAEGEPYVAFMSQTFGGAEAGAVKYWFTIFIVGLVGFIANFGPALLLGRATEPASEPAFGGYLPPPRHPPRPVHPPGSSSYFPAGSASHPGAADAHPGAWHGSPYHPGAAHMHGAPISINVSTPPPVTAAAAPGGQPPAASAVGTAAPPAAAPAQAAAWPAHAVGSIPALPAPPPADRPVDRGRVQQIADQLLTFKAACLEQVDGSRVTMDEIYARYASWAGGRAIGRAGFGSFFPETTGVAQVTVGDVQHLEGIRLRGAHVAAVAG